jgi:hypothetical protein
MKEEEWNENNIREFIKLIEQYKHVWKPTIEELKTINMGDE